MAAKRTAKRTRFDATHDVITQPGKTVIRRRPGPDGQTEPGPNTRDGVHRRRQRTLADGYTTAATAVDAANLQLPEGALVAVADTTVVEELVGKQWVEVDRRPGARVKL